MNEFSEALQQGWVAGALLGVPLLIVAALAGFAFALFQALTQIQDQALPQIVKIVLVFGMLALFGTILSRPLLAFAERAFMGGGIS